VLGTKFFSCRPIDRSLGCLSLTKAISQKPEDDIERTMAYLIMKEFLMKKGVPLS